MSDEEYFGRTEQDEAEAPEPDTEPAAATLTLAEIEKRTGISYVTLIRYAQQYRDRLQPLCAGEGVKRRYYPAAIKEFQKIKAEIAARQTGKRDTSAAQTPAQSPRRGRKKPRPKAAAKRESTATPPPVAPLRERPVAFSKIETGVSTAAALSPDLDRMARIYQLQIQRKALDGVLAFATEWWTRINSEIEELEK